jgi:hypothetical protein
VSGTAKIDSGKGKELSGRIADPANAPAHIGGFAPHLRFAYQQANKPPAETKKPPNQERLW